MKTDTRGSSILAFVFFMLLMGCIGIAVEYRTVVPGTSIIDRLRARPVVTDLDLLNGYDDLQKIKQDYHYLDFTCTAEKTMLGDYDCWATISKFNSIDAKIMAFFFRNAKLTAVRVSLDAENHPKMFSLLHKRYGPDRQFGSHADSYGNNIVGWIRPSGIVAINDHIEGDQEAILLWMSRSNNQMIVPEESGGKEEAVTKEPTTARTKIF